MATPSSPAAKAVVVKNHKKPFPFKLTTRDRVNFARYLSVMLDAGIPLHEALSVLLEQGGSPSLQYILSVAMHDLADGMPLHSSIAKFPKQFDSFFTNALSVGESTGTLPSTLRYLSTQMEKSDDLRGKVRSALFYPVIIFTGAIGIAVYLAFFMLPKILPLFTTLHIKLPATTQLLLNVSNALRAHWQIGLVLLGFLFVAIVFLSRIRRVRIITYQTLLVLPAVSTLIQNLQTAKFSRILGTLLSSGVTIVNALSVTADSTDNPVYKMELEQITQSVERGETIGSQLQLHPRLFAKTTASMVMVGERTGKLSESLISLAEFTEREVDVATRDLSTLIEPLTLIFVGLLVGFIALSIITPIYQITQGIHA